MKKLLALALLSMSFAACSTAYQSSDFSITGGYSEIRLSPETWRILVEGNAFTGRRETAQFLMRRAAELTLEQGKRYFVIERHDAWQAVRFDRDGDAYTLPRNEAIVTTVDQRSRDAFDAAEIIKETDEIAKHKLSAKAKATLATL